MWKYDKKLQYPVNIKNPDPQMAKFIISQYGGPYCIWYLYVKSNVAVAFSNIMLSIIR